MAEAVIAAFESELVERRSFRSYAEARMAVLTFNEGFYNLTRRNLSLGYLSPIKYEARTMAGNE